MRRQLMYLKNIEQWKETEGKETLSKDDIMSLHGCGSASSLF